MKVKWLVWLIPLLAILLASCAVASSSESEPIVVEEVVAEPVGEDTAETDSVAVEVAVPGLAEELALEASEIGPGWVRSGMDVRSEGNWIDQTFQRESIKDNLEFSEYAIEIIKVYPDVENALLDSALGKARWSVVLWEERLKGLAEGDALEDHLKALIEQAKLDWPFWDEAYLWNDIILRKGNIIVSFKVGRDIRRYDPLLEQYTGIQPFARTPEQEQWLDREQYADDLLYSLAEKARGKISEAIIE